MMGLKMLSYIDKRLRQASGKIDKPFGGYAIIFVGDPQQLTPIGDTCLYKIDESTATLIYYSISNVVILHESHLYAGKEYKIEYSNELFHVLKKEIYNKRAGMSWKKVHPDFS